VFIARHGRHELTTTILTAEQVRDLVERMLKSSGRRLDLSSPFVDAMLPNGHRLHVVLNGIVRDFVAVNVRKFVVRASRLLELAELGTIPWSRRAVPEAGGEFGVAGLTWSVCRGHPRAGEDPRSVQCNEVTYVVQSQLPRFYP
jgi:pilus assembly protein CpaF